LRALEDLIIDAIYQGVIQGKLDQKTKVLEIETTMGRDVKPESLEEMLKVLNAWSGQSDTILKNIKERISHATMMYNAEKTNREDFEKRIEQAKQNIKLALESSDLLQGIDMDDPDGERRKGRPGKNMKMHGQQQMHGMPHGGPQHGNPMHGYPRPKGF